MRLGEILVEQGLISQENLSSALRIQKSEGKPLGEILLQQGLINERVLKQSLASQAGVPYIEPIYALLDPAVLKGVSVEYLRRHRFVPFSRTEDGKTVVVLADLSDTNAIQAIDELYKGKYQLALGPLDVITETIDEIAHQRKYQIKDSLITDGDDVKDNLVVQMVDHILQSALQERVSDIHLEPLADRVRIRHRIDGVLVFKTDLPKEIYARLSSRLKIMADANIAEHRKHQGGRILYTWPGGECDIRLSSYVSVHGECIVLRLLRRQGNILSFDELGMNPSMLERFRNDVLDMPTGVVLITGPTGSGKTTTLYSSLDYSNKIDRKIITVEDPVEYMVDGIIQCGINEKAGRTFESSLREIVRQDPDIIVLGEIRDRISAETAIQAALTGHKVYSTFHTEDTVGGLVRLINMEIETFLISSTVISVIAQRLLRRICPQCAAPTRATTAQLHRLGLQPKDIQGFELKKGTGCKHCNFTGYYGRIAVYELLVINDQVREAILNKKPAFEIRKIGMESTGLVSMREDGIAKVLRGYTTLDEVIKHTPWSGGNMRSIQQILAITK